MSRKAAEGDYLLVVCGQTRYAPYLAGWQEFKDYLRKVVKEQPGWADVYPSSSQKRGEMQGWCRLRDLEDADAAYRVFYRSKGMLVHVWETCRSSGDFRLMRCNCSGHFPEVPSGSHSPGRCGIDIGRVNQLSGRPYPVMTTPYPTCQPLYSYNVYQQVPAYAATPMYSMHPTSAPVYSTSTTGMPVNVRGGAVLTEARGIFIRNLSYKATLEDLNSLLYTVGVPISSQLLRDPRTGVFKGVATAKFGSKEEASYAAACLNGMEHMGMALHVRMDTDITVVGRAEPMVVNGSSRC
ncbi:hypothetical protein ACN47E_000323 [Coniothyrium glycines]